MFKDRFYKLFLAALIVTSSLSPVLKTQAAFDNSQYVYVETKYGNAYAAYTYQDSSSSYFSTSWGTNATIEQYNGQCFSSNGGDSYTYYLTQSWGSKTQQEVPLFTNMHLVKGTAVKFQISGASCGHVGSYAIVYVQGPSGTKQTAGTLTVPTGEHKDSVYIYYEVPETGNYTATAVGVAYGCSVSGGHGICIRSSYDIYRKKSNLEIVYNNNGGTGSCDGLYLTEGETGYISNGTGMSKVDYHIIGWSKTPTGGIDYNLNQSITNPGGDHDKLVLYAVWEPNGCYVSYDANTGYGSYPTTFFKYNVSTRIEDGLALKKYGYTFRGWSETKNGSVKFLGGKFYTNPYTPGTRKTVYAVWEPNKYYVEYDANNGSGKTYNNRTLYTYDQSYKTMNPNVTGFVKDGYYIKYWSLDSAGGSTKYYAYDSEYPVGKLGIKEKFSNLTAVNLATVKLYAQWGANTYTLRLHDNFCGTDLTKDYTLTYDSDFILSQIPWSHSGAQLIGFDLDKTKYVNCTWAVGDKIRNLSTKRNAVVDVYCIWDCNPTITSPDEIKGIDRQKAEASGLNINNGTVSKSDLEAWLLAYCVADDYEWQKRYGGHVSPNQLHGYTLECALLNPDQIKQQAKDATATYYAVFTITDDTGKSSTSTSAVFISGKDIDIFIR